MEIYNYTVVFEPLEEGGYDVIVPASLISAPLAKPARKRGIWQRTP